MTRQSEPSKPKCKEPGLFPTERVVQFKNSEGEETAVFAPAGQVEENSGRVLVDLLEQNLEHSLVLVPARGGKVARVANDLVENRR